MMDKLYWYRVLPSTMNQVESYFLEKKAYDAAQETHWKIITFFWHSLHIIRYYIRSHILNSISHTFKPETFSQTLNFAILRLAKCVEELYSYLAFTRKNMPNEKNFNLYYLLYFLIQDLGFIRNFSLCKIRKICFPKKFCEHKSLRI